MGKITNTIDQKMVKFLISSELVWLLVHELLAKEKQVNLNKTKFTVNHMVGREQSYYSVGGVSRYFSSICSSSCNTQNIIGPWTHRSKIMFIANNYISIYTFLQEMYELH